MGGVSGDQLQRAEALLSLQRPAEAKALLVGAGLEVLSPRGWCLLSRCELVLGDEVAALEAARQAIAADPEGEWGYRLVSIAATRLDDLPAAVAAGREAVRLAPLLWQPCTALAGALARVPGRSQEALAVADRAVALAPTNPECHATRGVVLARMGLRHMARESFERALALDPLHANARNDLGVISLRGHKTREAADHFAAVAASDPRHPFAARNAYATLRVSANPVVLIALALALCAPLPTAGGVADHQKPIAWFALIPFAATVVVAVRLLRLPRAVLGAGLADPLTQRMLALDGLCLLVAAAAFLAAPTRLAAALAVGMSLALFLVAGTLVEKIKRGHRKVPQ